MAAQITPSPGGGRNRRRSWRPASDINVTPFVDVMLVLLVVFMVTAPMMTVAVPVDLPKTQARSVSQDKEPLVVSVDASGKVYLQEKALGSDDLVPKLKAITGSNPEIGRYGARLDNFANDFVATLSRNLEETREEASTDAARPAAANAQRAEGDFAWRRK